MCAVVTDISMSLDGFVAGPDPRMEEPIGTGGMRLHQWVFGLKTFLEMHGDGGGVTNADDDVIAEAHGRPGAVVMGRGMFGGGPGPWGSDPQWGEEPWEGWWGETPPYGMPVFVLTHHAREPITKLGGTTFTFVTDGVASAIDQAQAVCGDKDVAVPGGAAAIQQTLAAGLLDEIELHVIPVLLGDGVRLFDVLGAPVELEKLRVVDSPNVTHLRYRVVR
ncbi:MAG TPA: dihydrofolate reductase family protein [Solirubrobacteraceae bacterium]|jgi:dihydrofolate reductase|nr:dihydrofolate reductase family protein [Solirubrobacteraceae bacterium]